MQYRKKGNEDALKKGRGTFDKSGAEIDALWCPCRGEEGRTKRKKRPQGCWKD